MQDKIWVWSEKNREVWRVRAQINGGKPFEVSNGWKNKREADNDKKAWLLSKERQRLGECDASEQLAPLVEKFLTACKAGLANPKNEKPLSPATIKTYRTNLNVLLSRIKSVGEFTRDYVKDWKLELVEDDILEGWTIFGRLRDSRTFANWLEREGHIAWDPFETIAMTTPDAKPRYYSDEEIDKLEKGAAGTPMLLWVRLGHMAGMRYSEILNIKWEDIRWLRDPDNGATIGELTIWETKNGHPRTVPLPAEVMELLGSRSSGLLFPGWTRYTFRYAWAKLKAKVGLFKDGTQWRKYKWAKDAQKDADIDDQYRFHDLRHTFCKNYLQTGGNIASLRQITGHKSLDILVNTYSHFEIRHLHGSVKNMINRPQFFRREREVNVTSPTENCGGSAGVNQNPDPYLRGSCGGNSPKIMEHGRTGGYNGEHIDGPGLSDGKVGSIDGI